MFFLGNLIVLLLKLTLIGIIKLEVYMITYKTGDLLNEDVEAIVNTVNCVGVMGRGIALQFKKCFPENFKVYATACKRKEMRPSKMFIYQTGLLLNPKYIINFPTKRHWRAKSRIEDIETGLMDLVKVIRNNNITSIALPPLGCGLGGLEWATVKVSIEQKLSKLEDVQIIIFQPKGAPKAQNMAKTREMPHMTSGRAALIELIHRYFDGLLNPVITLLEVHKLMYFLQESGEQLKLNYKEGPYGPYAQNLRHVLAKIEGHFITGYADGSDNPAKELKLIPGAYENASKHLVSHYETKEHFNRVVDLVDGFETSFGLELLATIHWIVKKHKISSIDSVISKVHNWNQHKKQFSPRQIKLACEVLQQKNWLEINQGA